MKNEIRKKKNEKVKIAIVDTNVLVEKELMLMIKSNYQVVMVPKAVSEEIRRWAETARTITEMRKKGKKKEMIIKNGGVEIFEIIEEGLPAEKIKLQIEKILKRGIKKIETENSSYFLEKVIKAEKELKGYKQIRSKGNGFVQAIKEKTKTANIPMSINDIRILAAAQALAEREFTAEIFLITRDGHFGAFNYKYPSFFKERGIKLILLP